MKPRWGWHLALVGLLGLLVGLVFIREPGFGDDFTYWSFAFDLHERGLKAWSAQSFHNLRWPVWGVCWLLQAVAGPGLLSYYGEPLLYLAAGSMLAFTFARLLTDSPRAGWTASTLFLFHPLLDTVCHRPMPDLSEGIWGGTALLCWWQLVQAPDRGRSLLWMMALGACLYIAESNRITGAFFVPVVGVISLLYGRRRLGWIAGAGAVAAALYVAEAAFYHHLFHDWLHNLHANMGAKGKKGTEAIALWLLPFRFLGGLWDTSALSPLYALLALLGLPVAWTWRPVATGGELSPAPPRPLGRIVALWAVLLYLAYACAPQSLWPWRPMIREADRFLAGLAVPMALLGTLALCWLVERWRVPQRPWAQRWYAAPVLTGLATVALLTVLSTRTFYRLGFVVEMRQYLRSLPPGTKVFTHKDMREIAFLVDAGTARGLQFLSRGDIIRRTPELEAMAAEAGEFWYARKLLWLTTRKQLEQKNVPVQAALPSYIEQPERDWALARLLAKGDTPDLVFYRRRTPAMAAPLILGPEAPEWAGLLPTLPLDWAGKGDTRAVRAIWQVPPALRGKVLRLEMEASSAQVQAFMATLRFVHGPADAVRPARSFRGFFMRTFPFLYRSGARLEAEYVLKPYLHPQPGKEFFVLPIPAAAEECEVQLKLLREGAAVHFTGFRAVVEAGLVPGAEAGSRGPVDVSE